MRSKSAEFSAMDISWPLQKAQPAGAKLQPNIRISPINGLTSRNLLYFRVYGQSPRRRLRRREAMVSTSCRNQAAGRAVENRLVITMRPVLGTHRDNEHLKAPEAA